MIHIRQKNSSLEENVAYTVVVDINLSYGLHECLIDHPELFEVVNIDLPDEVQYLNYK